MAELLIHDGALYHRKKLQDEVLTIGREKTCGVLLQAESVSRKHCRLVRRPDGWLLQELDSRNGTWVNGRRLSVEWKLKDGDVVGIGKARLVFRERMTASQTFFWLLVHRCQR
ncbi:MAG: FHA domain-containing protein [Planctomycetes bacterium]|nr:FHA domain-containing protein [Planctomycetota bacterium]